MPAILGTNGPDVLVATDAGDVLWGFDHADSLSGGAQADTLNGGDGADTLAGRAGADVIAGDAGADWIIVDAGPDSIRTGSGADVIVIPSGRYTATTSQLSVVLDWTWDDRLYFEGVSGGYSETDAGTYGAALTKAGELIRGGAGVVAVQVGSDVYVFGAGPGGASADEAIKLVQATVNDMSSSNIGAPAPPPGVGSGPTAPPSPAPDINGVRGQILGNMDTFRLSVLQGVEFEWDDGSVRSVESDIGFVLRGAGFDADNDDDLDTGTYGSLYFYGGGFSADLATPDLPVAPLMRWIAEGATEEAFATILAQNDNLANGAGPGVLRGYGGDDVLSGGGDSDTIYGGLGNDVIYAYLAPGVTLSRYGGVGSTYLRGEEGNDWIAGEGGFDDINGNQGNDTASGRGGDDWVVGGRDNDLLFGNAGDDLVYGNIGADTCDGGDGNDIVRGGQDDDLVHGGAGADYVSGDRGADTMIGGAGADIFHSFGDAGLDRVTDFSLAQGDRVQLDPGTQYTVSQSGAGTVINMTGGGQMILVGVQMNSLTAGWIFGA